MSTIANSSLAMEFVRGTLLVLTLAFLASSNSVTCSGVFELELINYEESNPLPFRSTNYLASSSSNSKSLSNLKQQTELDTGEQGLVRMLVCIKEAFATNLDGPCTFGNASILFRDHRDKENNRHHANEQQQQQQQQHQQEIGTLEGYQSSSTATRFIPTSPVRIPFTFRWTVSTRRLSLRGVMSI